MDKTRAGLGIGCCVFVSACMLNAVNGSGKIVTQSRAVSGISNV